MNNNNILYASYYSKSHRLHNLAFNDENTIADIDFEETFFKRQEINSLLLPLTYLQGGLL